ncbi:UDP-N-acetylmuramoyl-tripeptide--D-alanyl-D-alanine ligase [Utexia brackfieldae]|uniref:UDP-N-acetylmuramoyl-tripeptide--D-alanyl-D- alanine ligase n=1 Tax=Utexia brackfieldae TaxID=3074108 RepID=UPI00370D1F6A
MIALSIQQLAEILHATLVGVIDPAMMVRDVSTDTRKIVPQSVFFALTGERFDGHNYVEQAIDSGASVAVVSRRIANGLPQLVVNDVLKALGQFAHWNRRQVNTRVVALTGSSGKTSVKEMTAAILKNLGQTRYTQGNLNNDIGVPLTLLALQPDDKYAVIELGANHIGEIAYTTELTGSESVLVNNIAAAHLEGFGSLAGVAKAKGEIFIGLPASGGKALLNYDSYSPEWLAGLKQHQVYFFSLQSDQADYFASDIVESGSQTTFTLHTPETHFLVRLPLIGRHNVSNAIAAAALAMSVGATVNQVVEGLSHLTPVKGRLFPIILNQSQRIFDDTYNANVGSMSAAINVLADQPGYRIFVVGDMGELGQDAVACHQQIGELAKAAGIDLVLSFGHLSQHISAATAEGQHFTDKAALVEILKTMIKIHPSLTILVKGSRSMRMEQVIEPLIKHE